VNVEEKLRQRCAQEASLTMCCLGHEVRYSDTANVIKLLLAYMLYKQEPPGDSMPRGVALTSAGTSHEGINICEGARAHWLHLQGLRDRPGQHHKLPVHQFPPQPHQEAPSGQAAL